MAAQIRQLYQIVPVGKDIVEDIFRNAGQRLDIELTGRFQFVKGIVYLMNGLDPRLFPDDIVGRPRREGRGHGSDGETGDA